jgi:predicted O-methyltransferase YrrM
VDKWLAKLARQRPFRGAVHSVIGTLFPKWKGLFQFPPGHFYSPLIDIAEIDRHQEELGDASATLWGGIDLQADAQRNLLVEFLEQVPPRLAAKPSESARYYSENVYFYFFDAFIAECMVRKFRPGNIIEIGSGFSSAQLLDVCERYELRTKFTFVEPNPERLEKLIRPEDWNRSRLIKDQVQRVSSEIFEKLESGDILFIDSSHVLKAGSDLAHILFRILPAIKPGVLVHFHDIFYPEAYPLEWLKGGRAWNESLVIRLLLQNARDYKTVMFNSYLAKRHHSMLRDWNATFNVGYPASLWLVKWNNNGGGN